MYNNISFSYFADMGFDEKNLPQDADPQERLEEVKRDLLQSSASSRMHPFDHLLRRRLGVEAFGEFHSELIGSCSNPAHQISPVKSVEFASPCDIS